MRSAERRACTRPGSPARTPRTRTNNARLLDELGDTPLEKRTAHYVCHVTVADPTGAIRAESHDVCHGRIRFKPAGENGFGYDPLFEVVEYHRTFGELGPHVKRALSHRSRALRAIVPKLRSGMEPWSMEQRSSVWLTVPAHCSSASC